MGHSLLYHTSVTIHVFVLYRTDFKSQFSLFSKYIVLRNNLKALFIWHVWCIIGLLRINVIKVNYHWPLSQWLIDTSYVCQVATVF